MTTAAINTTATPPMINWVRFDPGLDLRAAATDCRPFADDAVLPPGDFAPPAPLAGGGLLPFPCGAVGPPVLFATTRPRRPTARRSPVSSQRSRSAPRVRQGAKSLARIRRHRIATR